ncbi:DUF2167 domain-containing protein [Acetobacter sicerae]|uniref:DUF2167 domain-containing protein n=1 Tax=Acetobacter sicerae TaxID=85325 RepID=A0ABS8VQ40_9PROT|nr:DUF2167 domain-containing protein [Acetobacter sicerae]MCE0742455.1 DUF2167 domain-containing protein [Acetobacter sicerae]
MLFRFSACRWIALGLLMPLLSGAACSREVESSVDRLKRLATALKEAEASTQPSSSLVPIAGQGLLEVPEGTRFVPAEQTRAFLESLGSSPVSSVMGMIVPQNFYTDPDWMVVINWEEIGFVDENRLKNLSIRHATRSIEEVATVQNKIRQKTGLPAFHLKNLLLSPRYDTVTHSLEYATDWTIEGVDREGVLFSHYFIGRSGVLSFNFVAIARPLDAIYPIINPINQRFSYLTGHSYSDFDPAHDRRASYAHEIAFPSWQKTGCSLLIAAALYWLKRRRSKKSS